MPHILILGAHGQIARVATDLFLKRSDTRLTFYLRNAKRLKISGHADRMRVVKGDVLDAKTPPRWSRARAWPISSSNWR